MRFRGSEVQRLRLHRGDSINDAATRAGITRQQWLNIERGRVLMPHAATVRAIADALDVELSALYEDDPA